MFAASAQPVQSRRQYGGLAPSEAKPSSDADHREPQEREEAETPERLSHADKRGDPSVPRYRRPAALFGVASGFAEEGARRPLPPRCGFDVGDS